MEFGKFIKRLRQHKELSLKEVEKSTGISNSYLSQIENGKRKPPHPSLLKKLAILYGVRTQELLERAGYIDEEHDRKVADKQRIDEAAETVMNDPEYQFGRPILPLSDMVYSSILKVFTTFSLRRFMSDMQIAKEKGYVDTKPCYASVGHFMQKKEITPLLADMVTITSLPLRSVEKDFGIDATGFGTSKFDRWFSFKYGREIKSRKWVKCHFMNGHKTNVISSVRITTEYNHDSPELPELVWIR